MRAEGTRLTRGNEGSAIRSIAGACLGVRDLVQRHSADRSELSAFSFVCHRTHTYVAPQKLEGSVTHGELQRLSLTLFALLKLGSAPQKHCVVNSRPPYAKPRAPQKSAQYAGVMTIVLDFAADKMLTLLSL